MSCACAVIANAATIATIYLNMISPFGSRILSCKYVTVLLQSSTYANAANYDYNQYNQYDHKHSVTGFLCASNHRINTTPFALTAFH
jgi:hypothetical protein